MKQITNEIDDWLLILAGFAAFILVGGFFAEGSELLANWYYLPIMVAYYPASSAIIGYQYANERNKKKQKIATGAVLSCIVMLVWVICGWVHLFWPLTAVAGFLGGVWFAQNY